MSSQTLKSNNRNNGDKKKLCFHVHTWQFEQFTYLNISTVSLCSHGVIQSHHETAMSIHSIKLPKIITSQLLLLFWCRFLSYPRWVLSFPITIPKTPYHEWCASFPVFCPHIHRELLGKRIHLVLLPIHLGGTLNYFPNDYLHLSLISRHT